MSSSPSGELPALDCHAHIACDVTARQVTALGDAFVFAMTRSLGEAARVKPERQPRLVWGCGVHPQVKAALDEYSERRFAALVDRFVLVGEIGLDRWSAQFDRQREVLVSILGVIASRPVLCSIHSAGCASEVVELLGQHRPRGAILHWFTGESNLIAAASELGCAFSVNGAMTTEQLAALPADRVLPETDFPVARRRGAGSKPGDTHALESRLAHLWREPPAAVRSRLFRNLRKFVIQAGVLDELPEELADVLIAT